MTTIRVKEVAMIRIEGAKERIVIRITICIVLLSCCGLAAVSTERLIEGIFACAVTASGAPIISRITVSIGNQRFVIF
jgi:hypothetical protein